MIEEEINGLECKFVVYIPTEDGLKDFHVVKERKYVNGVYTSKLRQVFDYERPFHITKQIYRDHTQKKEAEYMSKVNNYMSTQKNLGNAVGIAIGREGYRRNSLRDFKANPYIYGTDIDSEEYLKLEYKTAFNIQTESDVATLDIEADVDTGIISINTVTRENEVFTAINKELVAGIVDPIGKIRARMKELLPDVDIVKNLKLVDIQIYDTEYEVATKPIEKLHEWSPDLVSIWNSRYDIGQIEKAILRADKDPKDVWSDPSIPDEYKHYNFKLGSSSFVSSGGVLKSKTPESMWDTLVIPASFYIIDSMQVFRQIRITANMEPGGYGLDNIMNTYTKQTKLKIKDPDVELLTGEFWHKHMVKYRPIDYIVYNIWDNLGMKNLDDELTDLKLSIGVFSDIAPFRKFNSGPRKLAGRYFQHLLKNDMAMGTARDVSGEDELLGRREWTITLPAPIRVNAGSKITNHPLLSNYIEQLVADLDQTSGYPSNTVASGLSRDNTRKEWKEAKGIPNDIAKRNNLNIVYGDVNITKYATEMFKLPKLSRLLD